MTRAPGTLLLRVGGPGLQGRQAIGKSRQDVKKDLESRLKDVRDLSNERKDDSTHRGRHTSRCEWQQTQG